MASFIKARYIDLAAAGDIQKYLTLNVENAYRVMKLQVLKHLLIIN